MVTRVIGERISDDGSVITNHGIITVNEATHDDEPEQYDV